MSLERKRDPKRRTVEHSIPRSLEALTGKPCGGWSAELGRHVSAFADDQERCDYYWTFRDWILGRWAERPNRRPAFVDLFEPELLEPPPGTSL